MDQGTSIGSLYYDLDASTGKLDKSLDQTDKKIKDFGRGAVDTGESIKIGMKKAAAGLAIVGGGLAVAAKISTDFTIAAVKDAKGLAREIGTTVEEASRLNGAFSRMGVTTDVARAAFGVFSKNIVQSTENTESNRLANEKLKLEIDKTKRSIEDVSQEIKKNGDKSGDLNVKLKELNNTLLIQQDKLKESKDGFAKLSVSTKDANGKQKDFKTLLLEVSDKFKDMADGADKTAVAMDLFGRNGKTLLPILNLGSDGIEDLEKKADKLGITLNENTIGRVNELVKSQKELKTQTDNLKIAIGTATAPILTEFNKGVNNLLENLLAVDSPFRDVVGYAVAFGGPIASGASALVGFAANLSTVAGALGLVDGAAAGATGSIVGLSLVSLGGWAVLIVAALGSVVWAADGTMKAIKKVSDGIDDLGKKKVQVGNSQIKVGGTSDVGLVEQLRRAFGGFAEGTRFAPGGMKWVGERGPELMNVPHGAQVIPNRESRNLMQASSNNTTSVSVDLRGAVFRDQTDIQYMVNLLGRNVELASQGLPTLRGAQA